jgi:pilus assembly protein CpaF
MTHNSEGNLSQSPPSTAYETLLKLLQDEDVSEVMINSPTEVFVEKKGKITPVDIRFESAAQVTEMIKKITRPAGGRQDWNAPVVSARLPDGSRVHAVFSPVVLGGGPSISIRKFLPSRLTLKAMVQSQTMNEDMAFFLSTCVTSRLNIVVSGGTSSGKTSLLNALSTCIEPQDRIITIEDTAELKLKSKNIVRLECQAGDAGADLTMRDLVKSSLRMRPDRIIVGETRGAEAFDMLQAMNTGHEGSMTTIHSNSPRDGLARIETMCLMANVGVPLEALRRQIASSVDIIVQMSKQRDGSRKVVSISEVCGMEGATILTQEIFHFMAMGEAPDQTLLGKFSATGIVPRCVAKFRERNIQFPKDFFSGVYRVDVNRDQTLTLPVRKK